uniref:Musashi RNA-binding protein 2b n=1 Tax=Dicentrarchus labrax TaxID=13489 RepID=A0A8P4KTY3_DICLA
MEGDGSQATSAGSPTDPQHDPGKMFIGGLSWQTSPDSLRDYFSKFGEIRECMVMRDPTTKRSRGFGFITFADAASVDKVLAQPHHELDSKMIDPKVAFPRRAQPKMVTRTKKIFVGGLSANTVIEDVKQYFEQFGKVEDAMLMFDKTTNRHRAQSALCCLSKRADSCFRNVLQYFWWNRKHCLKRQQSAPKTGIKQYLVQCVAQYITCVSLYGFEKKKQQQPNPHSLFL